MATIEWSDNPFKHKIKQPDVSNSLTINGPFSHKHGHCSFGLGRYPTTRPWRKCGQGWASAKW